MQDEASMMQNSKPKHKYKLETFLNTLIANIYTQDKIAKNLYIYEIEQIHQFFEAFVEVSKKILFKQKVLRFQVKINNPKHLTTKMRADTSIGGGSFNMTVIGLIIVNLPFIVCDFMFANQPGCVNNHVPGLFPLSDWLRVDGWSRIIIVGLFVSIAILNFVKRDIASKLLTCTMNLLIAYTVFAFIWLILGAIIYWGHLYKERLCDGGINAYMWVVLILGFLSLLLHCWVRRNHH